MYNLLVFIISFLARAVCRLAGVMNPSSPGWRMAGGPVEGRGSSGGSGGLRGLLPRPTSVRGLGADIRVVSRVSTALPERTSIVSVTSICISNSLRKISVWAVGAATREPTSCMAGPRGAPSETAVARDADNAPGEAPTGSTASCRPVPGSAAAFRILQ
ncbi:uncharacterized protein LOC126272668 [Schistocerca gregaria]|uniref:uncharacterized protein LOC126272668 n=1 Tax=Schistocerca gregaria TaxID=7010 RepID=UPI00211DF08E|nr:uncharacterized protein LOC126272668 [Schistocerca gregaria]